jgi:hypothetical protein
MSGCTHPLMIAIKNPFVLSLTKDGVEGRTPQEILSFLFVAKQSLIWTSLIKSNYLYLAFIV